MICGQSVPLAAPPVNVSSVTCAAGELADDAEVAADHVGGGLLGIIRELTGAQISELTFSAGRPRGRCGRRLSRT